MDSQWSESLLVFQSIIGIKDTVLQRIIGIGIIGIAKFNASIYAVAFWGSHSVL